MLNKSKLVWIFILIISITAVIYFGSGIPDYLKFMNIAESATSMPAQDGGKITMVRQPCILDTPANAPVTCAASCPLVTSALGSACTGYIELDTISQLGTLFIAAPVGFVYKGGGTFPVAGMQYIYGGASNIIPWIIGIPSVGASRIQKLVNAFNFIIAGMIGN